MLSNTRIPLRLSVGFGSQLVILLLTSAFAFWCLVRISTLFMDFAGDARAVETLGHMQGDVSEARLAAYVWRTEGSQIAADELEQKISDLNASLDALPARQRALAEIQTLDQRLDEFAQGFDVAFDHQYRIQDAINRMRATGERIEAAIVNDDMEMLRFQSAFGEAAVSSERFLVSNRDEHAVAAETSLAALNPPRSLVADTRTYMDAFSLARDETEARNLLFSTLVDQLGPEMSQLARSVSNAAMAEGDAAETATRETASFAELSLIGLVLAGLIVSLVTALAITRSLTRPINQLLADTQRLTDGEYGNAVSGLGRRDEMGNLAQALDVFREQLNAAKQVEQDRAEAQKVELKRAETLRTLIGEFEEQSQKAVGDVAEIAATLRESSSGLHAAASSSEQRIASVAAASEEASASVETVASSSEEMATSVEEIRRASVRVAEQVGSAAEKAAAAKADLAQMEDSVATMGSVVDAINQVAEQTNLLALNATIEAARAGEAGKGFAVVATEVKTLAEQTQRLNEEIAAKIGDATDRARAVALATTEVLDGLEAIRTEAGSTASAVQQQSAATAEISRAAQEAARGSQETSSNIEGIRSDASETLGQANTLQEAGHSLDERARTLQSDVTDFLGRVRSA